MFIGCDDGDVKPDCILERIQFDDFNSLKFVTISGGQVYQVTQEFELNAEVRELVFFQFTYFEDSIVVINQSDPIITKYPYLWVNLKDGRPEKVVRFFSQSAVRLTHTFDYSQNNRIRISIERLASTGELLRAGYGDYFFDDAGNVTRLVIFGIDPDDRSQLIQVSDQSFTYDGFKSPVKGLYLPWFNATQLPDPRFFSSNNILTVSENNDVGRYRYDYGENDQVQENVQPDGRPIKFTYVNCD